MGKFDSNSDEGIFLGYSIRSKAYRVYNKITSSLEESINVNINYHPKTHSKKEEETIEEPQEEPKVLENATSHDSGSESEEANDDEVSRPKEKRITK